MRLVAHDSGRPSRLEKILSMFAEVRPGEGLTALLLMLNVFTLLTAYYIIKPVREALILSESSAEVKSYASAGQAALLLLIIPLYSLVAKRVNRLWLINGVTAFFISNLFLFFALGKLGTHLGIVFYLWVGLFNVMIIAQFWAFANDLYNKKKGERLFGLIGIGASIGAILGAAIARQLFEPIGPYSMMVVTAALLALCMILTTAVNRREKHQEPAAVADRPETTDKPLGNAGGFQLIFSNRYLLAIAFLVLISNFVNTTGEFILSKTVETHAETAVAGGDVKNYIGEFYADFYFWVNLMGAVIQMFAVSRIMQYLGTGAAVLFLPILAFGSYAIIALIPVLSWIRLAKIAENTTDYSVQNTARHALFLPTSREAKYKAKTAVDSFFWRMGDALSGLLVYTGTNLVVLTVRGFALVNLALVGVWLVLAIVIARSLKQGRSATGMAA